MADNMTGVFNEQLHLTVNLEKWQNSLKAAKKEWDEFKNGLGKDAGSALSGSGLANIAKGISELAKLFENLMEETRESNARIKDIVTKTAEAEVAAHKKAANEIIATEEAKQKKLAKLKEQPFGLDKTARDIRTEQEGVLSDREKLEQDVNSWWQNAIGKREEAERKATQKVITDRQRLEQEVNDWWLKQLHQREQAEVKSAKKVTTEREKLEQAVEERWQKNLRQRDLLEAEAERRSNERRAANTAGRTRVGTDWLPDNARRIADHSKQAEEAYARVWAGFKTGPAQTMSHLNELNKRHVQITKEMSKQSSLWDAILNGGGGTGIKHTLAHLIRFYTLWNLINGAVTVFTTVLATPLRMLASAWQYLAQTERSADDMVGVIATNAKFSKDYAENFKAARTAAIEVTKALEEQAIATGFSAEQIEGTFKALLSSGAGKYVKTLNEMVGLATMFQMALKAAGAGGLAAQTSIQEMAKLWNGTPGKDNKFLQFVGMKDIGEWKKFREEAEKTRDLYPRLAEKSKAYRDALLAAGQGQKVLLDNLKLIANRIGGIALESVFNKVNSALIKLNTWLQENKERIAGVFKFIGERLGKVIDMLVAFFSNKEQLQSVLTITISIAKMWMTAAEAVGMIVKGLVQITDLNNKTPFSIKNQVKGAGNILGGVLLGATAPFQPTAAADAQKFVDDLGKAFSGGSGSSFLDKMFEPGGDKNLGKDDIIPLIVKRYETIREKIEYEIDQVEARYQEKRGNLSERLADNLINKATFSDELKALVDEEQASIRNLRQQLLDETGKARMAILGQAGLDPIRAQEEAERFSKVVITVLRRIVNESTRAKKEIQSAEIQAIKESEAVEKTKHEFRLRNLKDEQEAELKLISQAQASGYLTPLQAAEAEEVVRAEQFKTETEVLTSRMKELAESGEDWSKVQEELSSLGKKRQAEVELYRRTIEQLVVEEGILADTYNRRVREQETQATELDAQRERVLSMRSDALPIEERYLQQKMRELEITKAVLAVQYAAALARNDESEQTRALALSLEEVNQQLNATGTAYTELSLRGLGGPLLDIRRRQLGAGPDSGIGVRDGLFGIGFSKAFDATKTTLGKFGLGLVGASNALAQFQGILSAIRQGYQEGGVVGGIGAGLGQAGSLMGNFSGKEGSFTALMGKLGPYAQAVGAIFSIIGGLFTRAAKRIADEVKREMDTTITVFNRGQATLVDTIASLERQRVAAITQLSGKKGGKDELNKLLPQFDDQIFQLKKQQEQIIETFNESLDALRLNSDTLVTVKNQWQAINKEVKEYLGAGGDAAAAAEYLSLQLGKIRQDAIEQLNDAEQDAIQSVYRLNDLLKERQEMVNNFKRSEFDLMNADAVDRRQAGSISRGRQLADLRRQHAEDLARIDEEINRTQIKVDKEREIFGLVNDTASLRRRDEELTLLALDQQIQKLKDLQSIVSNINLGPGGWVGAGVLGTQNVTINVDISAPVDNPADFGREIGNSLADEFMRRMRMSPNYVT